MRRGWHVRPVAAVALVVAVAACGASKGGPPPDTASGSVVVLAASSLTEPFRDIKAAFERSVPDVDVSLSFAGSSDLGAAILEGAPADVFASADVASMGRVAAAGLTIGDPVVLATNGLEIVVADGNPQGIRGLDDLTGDVVVALCLAEVPCGAYAEEAFRRAGLEAPHAGREANVKAVVSKVQLGEADAGVVYRTDVRAASGVSGVELQPRQQVPVRYPVSVLAEAPNPRAASRFVRFLQGNEAQAILRAAGFGPS